MEEEIRLAIELMIEEKLFEGISLVVLAVLTILLGNKLIRRKNMKTLALLTSIVLFLKGMSILSFESRLIVVTLLMLAFIIFGLIFARNGIKNKDNTKGYFKYKLNQRKD